MYSLEQNKKPLCHAQPSPPHSSTEQLSHCGDDEDHW